MSTLVAIRHNAVIRTFYERLLVAGKPKKVALTACMHKLLTILNAISFNTGHCGGSRCPPLDTQDHCFFSTLARL